jgi:GTPase SAR1 family protein
MPDKMVRMSLATLNSEKLSSLKHLQLLDSIDKLRSQGIDHYISLPQIIVCGDQSSGKSSVLEAISGVKFPVRSNLCTRFPIELRLRKTATAGINVTIQRELEGVSKAEREANDAADIEFEKNWGSYEDLPSLVESANAAMGLLVPGKAFSKDTLRIEISGPTHPHLTIVDLPGLIHSETKHQSASDIEKIQSMVQKYMKESRSIILAIVSAKNDYANQIVLELARKADPTGTRTLGVITKPDKLVAGTNNEDDFIQLAKNKEVELRLGWHVLKNMDSDLGTWTLAERDDKETKFFSEGAWIGLPESSVGIVQLREKLSSLLFKQIVAELPRLITEIQDHSLKCREELKKLGKPRSTEEEQRIYMFEVGERLQVLLRAAVDGNYNDPFFGNAESDSGYHRRFRAVIQNLGDRFAEDLKQHGQRLQIVDRVDHSSNNNGITRSAYIEKIVHLMKRSRGRELPGMFDPMIVTTLFQEQSSPWAAIATSHVKRVWQAAERFLRHLAIHVADASTAQGIMRAIIDPKLAQMQEAMSEQTNTLLEPHQKGHPITYDLSFAEGVPAVRKDRESSHLESVLISFFSVSSLRRITKNDEIDLRSLHRRLLASISEESKADNAASQALDYAQVYYQVCCALSPHLQCSLGI